MKLLIIDTETTGIEKDSPCCEIAATLYNVGKFSYTTGALISVSTLLPVAENNAESINGITPELTAQLPENIFAHPLSVFSDMIDVADYCIAFNADFDKEIIAMQYPCKDTAWLCAMQDFDWGYPSKSKYGTFKLTDLALWLGIGVSFTHRAGDDVRLLTECFNRQKDRLPLMVEKAVFRANSPAITLKALVTFDEKQLAKDAGFEWKPETKSWVKTIKECDRGELLKSVSFDCEVINNATT